MRKYTFSTFKDLFEREQALVHTASIASLNRETPKQLTGGSSHSWISTSLAPSNGWMSYYGDRQLHEIGVAVVFDLEQCDQSEFWCYPSGYFAKLDHNCDSTGRPKKTPAYIPGAAPQPSRHEVGMRHRPSDLIKRNRDAVHQGRKIVYNEVYIKTRNPQGLLCYKDNTVSRMSLFLTSANIANKTGIELPIAISRSSGLSEYAQRDFAHDLIHCKQGEWQACLRASGIDKASKQPLCEALLKQLDDPFLQLVFQLRCNIAPAADGFDWGRLDAEQHAQLVNVSLLHSPEWLFTQLQHYPADIEHIDLSRPDIANTTQERLHALKVSRLNADSIDLSVITEHERQFQSQCNGMLYRFMHGSQLQKWRDMKAAITGLSGNALISALCDQLRLINRSAHRKAVLCQMLQLPVDLPAERLHRIAELAIANSMTESLEAADSLTMI